jgi:nucleoside-diphosphate-sugar epimerase
MIDNLLITGSSGLIGGGLVEHLSEKYNVMGISRSTGHDVGDYLTLENIKNTFAVAIHCAASFENDDGDSIVKNEIINSFGTLNVCRLAEKRRCKYILYISTISAIESSDNEYYNSYAMSKKHGEDNLRIFCESKDISWCILRFSQIYDSHGLARRHQEMLYWLIDEISGNRRVELHGLRNPMRNYINLMDVIEIIARVVEKRVSGAFNCVHPESHSLLEVVDIISSALMKKVEVTFNPQKQNIRNLYIPQEHSLYDVIDYRPRISLVDGIRQIVEFRV